MFKPWLCPDVRRGWTVFSMDLDRSCPLAYSSYVFARSVVTLLFCPHISSSPFAPSTSVFSPLWSVPYTTDVLS